VVRILTVAGLVLSACTAGSPPPATTTTAVREFKPEPKREKSERQPEPVIWRTVGSWSGRGNVQTGSFSVETGAMRIRWQTSNEAAPGAGAFRLSLHSAISGRPLQVAVDQKGVGRDTTYIEDEPRVSYLVVDSHDIDWAVTLEEAVPGAVEPVRK
jgi:outer membrane biogenesis lipoprotein LolB